MKIYEISSNLIGLPVLELMQTFQIFHSESGFVISEVTNAKVWKLYAGFYSNIRLYKKIKTFLKI